MYVHLAVADVDARYSLVYCVLTYKVHPFSPTLKIRAINKRFKMAATEIDYLGDVDRITARVERGEGVLGQLMTDSVLVGRAGDVLQQLDLLLADLRENPKRYVRLSIF